MTKVPLGFIPDTLLVPLDQILPSRKTPTGLITSVKFKQIRSSLDDVGLIEPLSVTAANKTTGQHLLLDGHVRLIALTELGFTEAPCLVVNQRAILTICQRPILTSRT